MGDQVIIESFFPGLEIVSKNPFDLSGNDELCLEVQGGKRFENKVTDFWHIVFGVKGDGRFLDGGKFLEVGIVDDFLLKIPDGLTNGFGVLRFNQAQNKDGGTSRLTYNQVPFAVIKSRIARFINEKPRAS